MARAAATGIRLGPLVKLLRPRGCGAGSSVGTGSAAGWRLQSPWVRSSPCLFRTVCSFLDTASQLTGLAPSAVGPSRRSGRAWGSHRNDRKCRYAGSQVGTARLCAQQCQIDATRSCLQLALQKGSETERKPPVPGGGRALRTTRRCGASAQTARDTEQRVMS